MSEKINLNELARLAKEIPKEERAQEVAALVEKSKALTAADFASLPAEEQQRIAGENDTTIERMHKQLQFKDQLRQAIQSRKST
jgi:hypothetical protein